ncbi:hypothetical protein HK101_006757 [Irineochytrium annulatum]|nr:hypothetical protein HK101_006757 [Irineochytrium annulatum]
MYVEQVSPGSGNQMITLDANASVNGGHGVGGMAGTAMPYSAPVVQGPSMTRKEWFDQLLALAHQKYDVSDYSAALAILQDLYSVDRTHLPTLLLLGCTCHSLGLNDLSIFYNNIILGLDPLFAEAYSNLGTTYRALALSAKHQGATSSAPSTAADPSLPSSNVPALNLELAERYYRAAITIRPRYWDAAINLAGLLSSNGRFDEAFAVYDKIERMTLANDFKAVEGGVAAVLGEVESRGGAVAGALIGDEGDQALLSALKVEEMRLAEALASVAAAAGGRPRGRDFTPERRRDLYYAKGNLLCAMGDGAGARKEYFRGLIAVRLDLAPVFEASSERDSSASSLALAFTPPSQMVTPQQSMMVWQEAHMVRGSKGKGGHAGLESMHHPTTSSILQTLAKMGQDGGKNALAVALYYLALRCYPTANACNNLGILVRIVAFYCVHRVRCINYIFKLAPHRMEEAIQWYELGLRMDVNHVHLYTNLGSALKDRGQVAEGIVCYERAIAIQPNFHIALANLANVFKDQGRVEEAISLYRRALESNPNFIEAFCNYVNSLLFVCEWTDRDVNLARVRDIIAAQLRLPAPKASRVKVTPEGKQVVVTVRVGPKPLPTVLPFHTFTYATLTSYMIREISRRNADRVHHTIVSSTWHPGPAPRPLSLLRSHQPPTAEMLSRASYYPYPFQPPRRALLDSSPIHVGYVSSDFADHPLSHLMRSVFSLHDRSRFRVYCYSLANPDDTSPYRASIREGCDSFVDISGWPCPAIVSRILADGIHVLVDLNGYTRGGRGEIFASRPAPVQVAVMGYAGTMGTDVASEAIEDLADWEREDMEAPGGEFEGMWRSSRGAWIDYMVSDEVACPRRMVRGEACGNVEEDDRMYTEGMIYMPHSFFVNDHRQGFREPVDKVVESIVGGEGLGVGVDPLMGEDEMTDGERLAWRREQVMRAKMRSELFPWLNNDSIIFANFNQLYKVDPLIFDTWCRILKRVPNSILWLLRFPAAGEVRLKQRAAKLAGQDVADRIVFTDVAMKHAHIHRGRIADLFLDTPECNAHTTAADILWSGTPILTFPKYDFRMCSRVAASVAYATGSWPDWEVRNGGFSPTSSASSSSSFSDGEIMEAVPGLRDADLPARIRDNPWLLGHDMVVNSYEEYENRAVWFGEGVKFGWVPLRDGVPEAVEVPQGPGMGPFYPGVAPVDSIAGGAGAVALITATHVRSTGGRLTRLRRRLFLGRDEMPLFDTQRWVTSIERGFESVVGAWAGKWDRLRRRNDDELRLVHECAAGGWDEETRRTAMEEGKSNAALTGGVAAIRMRTKCVWVGEREKKKTTSPTSDRTVFVEDGLSSVVGTRANKKANGGGSRKKLEEVVGEGSSDSRRRRIQQRKK